MFQDFPYTDMHQLNLDWIVKIAKDFLEQYTHFQELIENGEQSLQDLTTQGLEQLQEKADALEALLQEWYNTHSDDIANQLADALNDLNDWYTEHQNYLDDTLASSIEAFQNYAQAEGQRVIDSIPDDYSTLAHKVETIRFNENVQSGTNLFDIISWLMANNIAYTGTNEHLETTFRTELVESPYIFSDHDMPVTISGLITPGTAVNPVLVLMNSNGETVAQLDPTYRYATGIGCMIKAQYSTGGTVTLENVEIKNKSLSNADFTETLEQVNSNDYTKNLLNLVPWFDQCGNSYTQSGNAYTFTVNNRNARIPCVFAPFDMPVHISGKLTPGTGTLPLMLFYNYNGDCVGTFNPINTDIDITASYFVMTYGNSGTFTLDLTITKQPETLDYNLDSFINVHEPDAFTWKNSALHNKIITDGKGTYQIKDFDIKSYKVDTPNIYYVDPYHGNDNNDGLSFLTAFKTILKAYSVIQTSGTIYLAPGVYDRTEGTWALGTIEKYINLISVGAKSYLSNTWIGAYQHSGGLLTYSTSIIPYKIVDLAHKTDSDIFVEYVQKETVAEVQNITGTWASVNGVLYINPLPNGWYNDKNVLVIRKDDANAVVQGAVRFYGENICFVGGTTPFQGRALDETHAPNIYMLNCEFWYGQGDAVNRNALTIRGCRNVILEKCLAIKNEGSDGFNYHDYLGYSPNVIEIDCIGMYNGDDSDGSDQGSTIHENVHIIRINGIYAYNHGANIADDGTGAQSWNIGCKAFKSLSLFPSQNSNYMSYGPDMWIEGCYGYSSSGNIAGQADSIHLRLPIFIGDLKSAQTSGDPTTY